MSFRRAGFVAAATVLALAVPAVASAATVTVGSPLPAFSLGIHFAGSATLTNVALGEPEANETSPVSGTVVRWRISGASGGPFELRVLTPDGGGSYTGAGTSSPATPISTMTQTFSTDLPIKAGQTIGLDLSGGSTIGFAMVSGSTADFWEPPLADGSTAPATKQDSDTELEFNADVVPQSAVSAHCVAPKLKGKKLSKLRKLLKAAHCALGAVKKPKHRKGKKLVVKSQSPSPGSVLPNGASVSVKLGPKPKRHHR